MTATWRLRLAVGVMAAALLVLCARAVRAQSTEVDPEREAATRRLLERIRAAKAEAEKDKPALHKDKDKDKEKDAAESDTDLSSPEEKKARQERRAKLRALLSGKPDTGEEFITDPNELRRRVGSIPRQGPRDLLGAYDSEDSTENILKRIRQARSGESERGREQEAEERVSPEPGLRGLPGEVPDYSLETKVDRDLERRLSGVGMGMLPGDRAQRYQGIGGPTRGLGSATLPDPSTDLRDYNTRMVREFGERGALPGNVNPDLVNEHETRRFGRWLTDDFDARLETGGVSLPDAYKAYRDLHALGPRNTSLGRRDTYVPYSTDYLSPTYRGTIYGNYYSSDPYQRSYAPDLSRSKFSNESYYNNDVTQSFSDYYQREYGVGPSFVPESSSRYYDVNTMKQWQNQLRWQGIDTRGAANTYSDLYRLQTNK
ncbi:MAG TPA: hypothetical protein VMY39_04370 [Planctomycetota bacterium]|nr:hypothetical protein [Planctomycetota bacterium]